MRSIQALITVSVLCATMAACGQPFATETGDGTAVAQSGDGLSDSTSPSQTPATTSTPTGGSTDTPTPTPPATTTGLCGTSATAITYAGQAEAVIKAECATCHGGGTSPLLTDYASSKTGFTNGGSQAVAAGSMPLGLTLTENQKCILTQWAANNYAP